jgi:hypothetical protein
MYKELKTKKRNFFLAILMVVILAISIYVNIEKKFYDNSQERIMNSQLKPEIEVSYSPNALPTINQKPDFDEDTRIFRSPKEGSIKQIEISVPDNWVLDYFNSAKEGYVVYLKSEDENYGLNLDTLSKGGSSCVFGNPPTNKESSWYIQVDLYTMVNTEFGEYNIGRFFNTRDFKTHFLFCKKIINPNGETEWSNYTDVGDIRIYGPEKYSENKINELINISRNIKVID